MSTSQDALTKSAHAVDLSRRALELANMQYRAGSVTYDTVLDAARAALRDADTLAQNQGLASQAVVSLYRALGGGWQVAEDQPTLSRRMSEEMSQRTDWGRLLDPHAQSPIAGNGGEKIEPGKY